VTELLLCEPGASRSTRIRSPEAQRRPPPPTDKWMQLPPVVQPVVAHDAPRGDLLADVGRQERELRHDLQDEEGSLCLGAGYGIRALQDHGWSATVTVIAIPRRCRCRKACRVSAFSWNTGEDRRPLLFEVRLGNAGVTYMPDPVELDAGAP
jgi:hypothetical protein